METVFSPYDVWVIGHNGIHDINKIYLVKDEAIIDAHKINESNKSFLGITLPVYTVMTLADAIDTIKEEAKDYVRNSYYENEF